MPMLMRFPRVRQLFSADGAPIQITEIYGAGAWLPVLPSAAAVALYALMVFCLLCAVIGYRTRIALVIGTPLYLYFNALDGVGTLTKYSVIAFHLLLLLTVSNCGAVWSVDRMLQRRQQGNHANVTPQKFALWPARLMQLLFAFIYFGAAITKIQTEAFFSGEQMRYWMLSNWNYDNPVGEVMAMSSPLLLIGAYITVIWEILFAFLVWRGRTRFIMLGVGALFHFMTWLTLGLYIFPTICISGYLAFVNEQDVIRLRSTLRKSRSLFRLSGIIPRTPAVLLDRVPAIMPAAVTFTLLACLTAVAAVELEYQSDLYGVRSENGPLELKPLDRNVAISMINGKQPLREKDKFFSFDLGSLTVGGQLANRKSSFEYGENIVIQCNLNPPHEDMWVECILQDDQQHIIEQFGQFVTRDMLHANFHYRLGNKLTPGRYSMLLRSGGQDIYRRPFELAGEPVNMQNDSSYLTN
jgi:hypothetical protein